MVWTMAWKIGVPGEVATIFGSREYHDWDGFMAALENAFERFGEDFALWVWSSPECDPRLAIPMRPFGQIQDLRQGLAAVGSRGAR